MGSALSVLLSVLGLRGTSTGTAAVGPVSVSSRSSSIADHGFSLSQDESTRPASLIARGTTRSGIDVAEIMNLDKRA